MDNPLTNPVILTDFRNSIYNLYNLSIKDLKTGFTALLIFLIINITMRNRSDYNTERTFFMFRLMGNIYKDTRIQKSTVICDDTKNSRTKRYFTVWTASAMSLIFHPPYGWMPTSKTFRNFQKYGFRRIILLKSWTLTIWNYRLLKKTDRQQKAAACSIFIKKSILQPFCYSRFYPPFIL